MAITAAVSHIDLLACRNTMMYFDARAQAQMLARGRLWLPAHPAADSFESFHIHVRPVYASMVFPGATLFHVPAVWLKLPYAVMPLVVAGAMIVS